MKCKRPSCSVRFSDAASTNEAQKYGYCSWNCLEAADPALAEQIRKQNEAGKKLVIGILVAIATAVFFVVKWLLRKRKENPPLFKKVMMWGGCIFAVILVLAQQSGIGAFSSMVATSAANQCRAIEIEYLELETQLEAQNEKLPDDIAVLEKAGVKCPNGGTYSVKDGRLVCSKHGSL